MGARMTAAEARLSLRNLASEAKATTVAAIGCDLYDELSAPHSGPISAIESVLCLRAEAAWSGRREMMFHNADDAAAILLHPHE